MDLSQETDRTLSESRRLVTDNQTGGRHRLQGSIGKGSANLKMKSLLKKVRNIVLAIFAIWLGAGIAGALFNGIGFLGVMAVVVATALAVAVFSSFPKIKAPKRAELKQGSPQQMVAKTELWLESQAKALPPPAVPVVQKIGVQLDALGLQLETIDPAHPAMNEARELVGDYLPETIDNYRKIPEHLRKEEHTGKSADERLTDSLGKLSGEIDRVTRQLAEGAMVDLAIKDRYLEYRYGGVEALSDEKNG